MIDLFIALSPLLTVGFGGLLLMLAEALGKPANNTGMSPDGAVVVDAGAGRSEELGLGAPARDVGTFRACACPIQ